MHFHFSKTYPGLLLGSLVHGIFRVTFDGISLMFDPDKTISGAIFL